MRKNDFRILFMGTPYFAAYNLEYLLKHDYNIVGVVTAPDKKAGRGLKIKESEVKKTAQKYNLPILQPQKLKNPDFVRDIKELNPHLIIVVAFRMLPKEVWQFPPYGTINLHASLLPNYRGAAPINWAIINGEKETGVTTFFINENIDTGNILLQEKVNISPEETAGSLHDKLMETGAELLEKTVDKIMNGDIIPIPQDEISLSEIKFAPKIFKEDCKINWKNNTQQIYNFIRGLSPYPGAWSNIKINEKETEAKILYASAIYGKDKNIMSGEIKIENGILHIATTDGYIVPIEIKLASKKAMDNRAFINGYKKSKLFFY